MTPEHFDGTLTALKRQVPYRPFTISLMNGDRFEVDYPDALVVREGVAVYVGPGGIPVFFDHESVSQVTADLLNNPQNP